MRLVLWQINCVLPRLGAGLFLSPDTRLEFIPLKFSTDIFAPLKFSEGGITSKKGVRDLGFWDFLGFLGFFGIFGIFKIFQAFAAFIII